MQGILIRNVARQECLGHNSLATTLDIYSHVLPGLQEAAARLFEEGLQYISPGFQAIEVLDENVGKLDLSGGFGIKFEAGRGDRGAYGAALEKRWGEISPVGSNPTLSAERCWSWTIRRAWRARRGQPLVGSNPTLSASKTWLSNAEEGENANYSHHRRPMGRRG